MLLKCEKTACEELLTRALVSSCFLRIEKYFMNLGNLIVAAATVTVTKIAHYFYKLIVFLPPDPICVLIFKKKCPNQQEILKQNEHW